MKDENSEPEWKWEHRIKGPKPPEAAPDKPLRKAIFGRGDNMDTREYNERRAKNG